MSLYVGALVLAAYSAFLLWPVSARLAGARWVVHAPHAAGRALAGDRDQRLGLRHGGRTRRGR